MPRFKRCYFLLLFIIVVSGCQMDDSKQNLFLINQTKNAHSNVITVFNQNRYEIPSFYVRQQTNGNQVYIECLVNGISFRNENHLVGKVGKIVVSVDGKKSREISTAAFIMKDLPPGKHKLTLEVVKLNNMPYGLSKEIMVNIPR